MNKALFLLPVLLITLVGCATTELHVPAATHLSPRQGFLRDEEVNLVIYDGRTDREGSAELTARIADDFRTAFPSVKLAVLPETAYNEQPRPGRITIRIGISAYAAAFGPGVASSVGTFGGKFYYGVFPEGSWNGVTGLSVNVSDRRRGRDKDESANIGKVFSLPGMMSYSPERQALFRSYAEVIKSTVSFVENVLMR